MADNFAEMLINGHRILPALLADLEAARRSIHVSMFLFFRDPVGEEIADLLSRKAREGIKVRVLLNMEKTAMGDPFSTGEKEMIEHDPNIDYDPTDVKPMCQQLRAAGASVRDTNIDYDAVISGLEPRLESVAAQIRGGIAIDDMHIDHRKIIVVDGRVGFCGGANIGAQYLHHVAFDPTKDAKIEGQERMLAQLPEPWWKWHDSLTRFEGPIVTELETAFRERWLLDGGEPYELEAVESPASDQSPRGHAIDRVELFANEPNEHPNQVRELYVRLIGEARSTIFIENPYTYHPAIIDALCRAKTARPELDVVMILPAGVHNDNSFSQDAQEHEYERLLACGIRIYEYQNHFTHLKTAVFDERFSIHGSTNLNFRSLENDKDFELVLLVNSPSLAGWMLTHVRDKDIAHSEPITQAALHDGLDGLRRRVRRSAHSAFDLSAHALTSRAAADLRSGRTILGDPARGVRLARREEGEEVTGDKTTAMVTGPVAPAIAFDVFTRETELWWRRGVQFRGAARKPDTIQFEPKVGGRLFELYDETHVH